MKGLARFLSVMLAVALILPAAVPAFADTSYVVQPGDTLFLISLKFNVSMSTIMAANSIANPNFVYVGEQLVIPSAAGPRAPANGTTYVVQTGDTLFKIALKYNVTLATLMSANGIVNSNLIYMGQTLTIPGTNYTPTAVAPTATPSGFQPTATPSTGGATYIVQSGDTLGRIALRYGISYLALSAANGILNPNLIYVGQQLTIPGAAGTPVVPAPTSAATAVPTTPSGGSLVYTVVRGDTLWGISQKFGVSVASIMTLNGLTSSAIYIGQKLTISGAGPAPATPAAPAPTSTPVPGATPLPTAPPPSGGGSFELGGQANDLPGSAAKMLYAGMTWVKQQVRWNPGDTPSGGAIADAHSRGFKILVSVLANSPSQISGGTNFDSYASYVGGLAALGADGIEVWNEMNLDREWPAGQINPATYTDLLHRAYNQIKAGNAHTLVISGALAPTGAEGAFGLAHVWNDNHYLAGMVAAGALNYMDCVGTHYNEGILSPLQSTGDPRDPYYTRYYSGMVSTYWTATGGARPLCFTELGYLTPEGYGPLPSTFAWAANTTVAQQAQWLGQAATLGQQSNGQVRLMIVFNVDFKVYGTDPQAGYAIIRADGTCPACASLRAVTGGR
jgi:LysM repeat protein